MPFVPLAHHSLVTIRLTLRKADVSWQMAFQLFSASMYKSLRDESHALTRDELDLVVMGQLRALYNDRNTENKSTERVSTQFLFGGHVCAPTRFVFCTQ